jgi:ABC-2 type transport system ATP-binding protein
LSAAPVLAAHELRKTFRRQTGELVHALDGVSLEVRPGGLTALVGPDGSGKTTLIRLAAGLLAHDAGELHVLGLDAAKDANEIQSRVAYMPQQFGLYEDLTCQENLDLYADLHGVEPAARGERYARLMAMTGLGRFTGRLAGRLSGGMKQKLGLACTLVRVPELLLLDEPTVGVDPVSRRELWEIVWKLLEEGLSVLVSTSYLDEAERCESVLVLHEGKVLARGKPDAVTELAARRVVRVAPPPGQTAHGFQSRLLDDPIVLDAVPEGGRVRIVLEGRPSRERASPRSRERGRSRRRRASRTASWSSCDGPSGALPRRRRSPSSRPTPGDTRSWSGRTSSSACSGPSPPSIT